MGTLNSAGTLKSTLKGFYTSGEDSVFRDSLIMPVRMVISQKKYKFKQRFLQDEKVWAKTLETWSRHRSENAESGRILDNSENSSRYLNFTEIVVRSPGGSPLEIFLTTGTEPFKGLILSLYQSMLGGYHPEKWFWFFCCVGLALPDFFLSCRNVISGDN